MTFFRTGIVLLLLLALTASAHAGERPLAVAVASNFALPAEEIAGRFTARTGHVVRLSTSSTGKLYAQIMNGAPFDVFLAADRRRPRLLEEAGLGLPGTRFTYAVGTLVLWSRNPALAGTDCRAALENPDGGRIAIANPQLAPYGAAAAQFLERAGIEDAVRPRLVYGESIAQVLHFVATGNASLALIAGSQAIDARLPAATCRWAVPPTMHDPIAQDAVVLERAAANSAAAAFVAFLRSDAVKAIIGRFGYGTAP